MKRMLVNVRGCNGSGKSTIPMSMLDDPDMYVVEKLYKGKPRKVFTVFPNYGWVVLGSYHNKCGGLDGYVDTAMILKAAWLAVKKFPEYNILMEGVIPSTVYSTYEKLFTEINKKYPDLMIVVLSLLPPLEVCLERIQQRNGGKNIKEEQVASKWNTVAKNAEKFAQAGIISITWDNSSIWPKYKDKPMIKIMKRHIRKELEKC